MCIIDVRLLCNTLRAVCISNHFILFYSLDPDGDPLCALLMLDYYAIRSEQYEFLVRLFNEWEVRFLSLVRFALYPLLVTFVVC